MKILVISQHLFPIQTPRAHRTTELVKELSRQGHKVTLYAVLGNYNYEKFCKEFNIKLKRIPVKWQIIPYTSDGNGKRHFVDKVLGKLLGKLFEFPYVEFLFRIPQLIRNEAEYDALISISDPHQIHWGCARAKKKYPDKYPKKWIAESGDPFMDNGQSNAHLSIFGKFEKQFCSLCDFLTVPIEQAKAGYYKEFREKIRVIPQGFNFTLPIEKRTVHNDPITFAYAGIFNKSYRDPSNFLNYLIDKQYVFRFIVYTPFTDLISGFKDKLGDQLEIRAIVPREILLQELGNMDFLLNIENMNCPNQLPSKLIDYSLTGRPIMSINPDDVDKNKVDEFFQQNYSNEFIVENIEQYQISNVATKFVDLIK